MKLAEALQIRADKQNKIEDLRTRLVNSARYQEGEKPVEDPEELLKELDQLVSSLEELIYKIKGPDRICLVTDSMRGAGMPDGEYVLGNIDTGQKVIVEDGVAKLPSRDAFAGSVATVDRLVRNMVNLVDVPLQEAVKMMTYNPAKVMGIESNKGSIAIDKDADIIVFDRDIKVSLVMVSGKILINNL